MTYILTTAEDLYGLPDDGRRHELLRGALLSEPLPGGTHGRIVTRLAEILGSFVRLNRLGVVYTGDTGFILRRQPDTVRGPDVAYLSAERHRALEDERRFIPGAPDLVIEVLSPHDAPSELLKKVRDYLAAGSRLVWVVNPARQEATAFRSPLPSRVLASQDMLDGEEVLPGFSVRISEIFEI